jgi:hypothetical protein
MSNLKEEEQKLAVPDGDSQHALQIPAIHEPAWWHHACFFGTVLLCVLGLSLAQIYLGGGNP